MGSPTPETMEGTFYQSEGVPIYQNSRYLFTILPIKHYKSLKPTRRCPISPLSRTPPIYVGLRQEVHEAIQASAVGF
jgi:hypothetical protein